MTAVDHPDVIADPFAESIEEDRPRRADGVVLLGSYAGSGYEQPPSLARRADGQVIQLTQLLYLIAERSDGTRTLDDLAADVRAATGRNVTAANVDVLVGDKLRPLGLIAPHGDDGRAPDEPLVLPRANQLLALRFRVAVVPEWLSNVLAAMFQPLFRPVVVAAVLAGTVVADAWLFFHHGLAQATRQALYAPGIFLAIVAAVALSAAFHEVGHAAACRYSGGRPGRMGCGLYLAWPAFYTDVTDAYRLDRRGRLRTDLGGVYFNTIVVLATVGAFFATGYEPLLLLVVLQHVEIAHQLLPIVRLDGYYIVADMTGVPDLFNYIGPILSSLVPWRKTDPNVRRLKPWVRRAVAGWVVVVVPFLLVQLVVIATQFPRILATAWDSLLRQGRVAADAFDAGAPLHGVSAVVAALALLLPVVGLLVLFGSIAKRSGAFAWRRTEDWPLLRGVMVGAAVASVVVLVPSWLPTSSNYHPIRSTEIGTLPDGVGAVASHVPVPRSVSLLSRRKHDRPATDRSGANDGAVRRGKKGLRPTTVGPATPSFTPSTTTMPAASASRPSPETTTTPSSTMAPTTSTTTASNSTTTSPSTTTEPSTTTSSPSTTTTSTTTPGST